MNNTCLIGRTTKKPELKYTQNGKAVTTFTLAVNRIGKNNGAQEADFIQCVAWNKTAEIIAQYVEKGNRLGVSGRLQSRSYENQQGQKVYVTEVVAEKIDLLESANGNQNQMNENPYQGAPQQNYQQPQQGSMDMAYMPTDGQLPF